MNNFEQLPSLSQFPQLTVLKLLNCKRLKELPDLPSSIEVINAHNCISLEAISNQWQKSTLLRHAIFTNCFRMKELHSNMVSSFGNLVAEIYHPTRYLHHITFLLQIVSLRFICTIWRNICPIKPDTDPDHIIRLVLSKDQNIGKHGYIGNWILRKYRKYRYFYKNIGGYFYKNIGY